MNKAGRKKGGEIKIDLILNNKIPDRFILDETTLTAEWRFKKDEDTSMFMDMTSVAKISWSPASKTSKNIYLECTESFYNMNLNDEPFNFKSTLNFTETHLGFLENQFEKCYEEKNHDIGIKTLSEMCLIDINKLTGIKQVLLTVIKMSIKSSILTRGLSYLVWILIAIENGFIPKKNVVKTILGISKGYMNLSIKDNEWKSLSIPNSFNINEKILNIKKDDQTPISLILIKYFIHDPKNRIMIDRILYSWYCRMYDKSKILKLLKLNMYNPIGDFVGLNKSEINETSYVVDNLNNPVIDILCKEMGFDKKYISNLVHTINNSDKKCIFEIGENKYNISSDNLVIWNAIKERFYELALCEKKRMISLL